jgi:hypothetical protein
LEKFCEERHQLESAAGQKLKSFCPQAQKLEEQTERIRLLAQLIGPDLLSESFPATLEERSRLLRTIPSAVESLRQHREMLRETARGYLVLLTRTGLRYDEMADLLSTTARAFNIDRQYDRTSLNKRVLRSKKSA